jgi:MFS family permease
VTADQATASEDRRRLLALYVLCLGMLMIVLDATIVNVALPSIQDDMGFSQSDLAWVVNAYLIAFGGLLLLAGRIGDLVGQRRIFLIGLAVFTGASLLCALAQSQGLLIGARFVQGVGGALTSAVILGMIVTMFPEPREQAKAIGVYTFVAVAGGSLGLLAGGVLTQAINWHWIFFVNLPVGLATTVFAVRLVPDREGIGLTAGADLPGAALLTGGLMLGVYTILGVAEEGWGSSQTLALGAVSLALLVAFVARQARVENPLMPLPLFRSPNVAGATESDSGLASGLVNTSVQVGGAIGLAVLATLATDRTDGLLADGEPAVEALNSGYHLAYLIGAGLVMVAIATALSVLRSREPEAALEPAAEPVQGEVRTERLRIQPLPADVVPGGGCRETGTGVTIGPGCGGCAGSMP